MIVGKNLCSGCGKDCTNLWGFIMKKRPSLSPAQLNDFKEIEKEFGQTEFVFCWTCTAKAFGAKTVADRNADEIVINKPKEKSKTENSGEQ